MLLSSSCRRPCLCHIVDDEFTESSSYIRFKYLVKVFILVSYSAQDHPGGRINSVFHNGRWIETGAQWIHGENNEVWKLADKYDLLSTVTSCEGEGKK